MIDTVIFDLGNVLAEYDWQGFLGTFGYDRKTYDAVAHAVFLNEDWVNGDAGQISAGDWMQSFIDNAPDYAKQIEEVYASLGGCIRRFEYTDSWIARLRERGMRLYYLSNYSEGLYEKTKDQLSFIDTFDGGIFSYKERCIKPDTEIYLRLLKRYKIVPEHAVFYDDRIENVEAALKLGIHGRLFNRENVMEEMA